MNGLTSCSSIHVLFLGAASITKQFLLHSQIALVVWVRSPASLEGKVGRLAHIRPLWRSKVAHRGATDLTPPLSKTVSLVSPMSLLFVVFPSSSSSSVIDRSSVGHNKCKVQKKQQPDNNHTPTILEKTSNKRQLQNEVLHALYFPALLHFFSGLLLFSRNCTEIC